MDKNLQTYLKIYPVLPLDICKQTVLELEEKEKEFSQHSFYSATTDSYHSYEHELDIAYSQISTKDVIMKEIWNTLQKYMVNLSDMGFQPWFSGWNGYSEVRFNRYRTDTQMKLHCDHIHSMFDGVRKGIPTLTVLGGLNDDYEGGELIFWRDTQMILPAGHIMIFPSNFLYPHEVKIVKKGTRYSFVSWAW